MRQRFEDNLARVKHLVDIYATLGGTGQGRRPVNSTDLLRAATVFLHAAIEDLLRSMESTKLPAAAPAVLDGVPLVGLGPRPEKFFLGQLAPHRGSTVDDVIRRSVEAHLERATYGNATEVRDTITQCGLDPAPAQPFLDSVNGLMRRRHHIVHQADREEVHGRGHHRARSLSRGQVQIWLDAARGFGDALLNQLPNAGN